MNFEKLQKIVRIILVTSLGVFVLFLYGNLTGIVIFGENVDFPYFGGIGIFALFLIFTYFALKLRKK